MLRLTVCFLFTALLLVLLAILSTQRGKSFAALTRVTNTAEQSINLNPTLSDDGKIVVFESSADLAATGARSSFHALRADLTKTPPAFGEIGATRIVSPALSSDGRVIAFASTEDLVGRNADRNSEIFVFDGSRLEQVTQTDPAAIASRLSDGNFQPSVTADGRTIAFSSTRNLTADNADLSYEIFVYNVLDKRLTQLTSDTTEHASVSPKISGDGARVYYKRTSTANPAVADLVLIETATGTARVVAADVPELSLVEGRAVSNDGMRVAYAALTAPNETQVFLFDGRDTSVRKITQLGSRVTDVKLQPTISGDGRRVAFATRRRVTTATDGSVELYVLDLPSGQVQQITNAPSTATGEVIASLNFDGSFVAFSFPRILSGSVSDEDLRNNSEIYLSTVAPRPIGVATVVNAAARGNQPRIELIAPGSIATISGSGLALKAEAAVFSGSEPPFDVGGTTVSVNGRPARIFYVSAGEVVFVMPGELGDGPAEVLVTNSEGLSSDGTITISSAAPGVFTLAGDGHGDAIILNSDTLTPGPFDPTRGDLRLSIFASGVVRSKRVFVTISGKDVAVETVVPARLLGLDEIHIRVPAELRGSGVSTLIVTADDVQSNPTSVLIGGVAPTPTPTLSPSPTPSPSHDPSPLIVISQIFGGGGNSGAPLRNDFIEIFNGGNVAVNLNGWSVQYASATASTWSVTPLTAVTLQPGQYFLVQESSGGSAGVVLTSPDANGSIAMAAGSGKVALVKNSTALAGICPSNANIVDLLGYGSTANCFKGSAPAAAPSNTNALLRQNNGCGTSFILGPPNPRNTKTLPHICADQ